MFSLALGDATHEQFLPWSTGSVSRATRELSPQGPGGRPKGARAGKHDKGRDQRPGPGLGGALWGLRQVLNDPKHWE